MRLNLLVAPSASCVGFVKNYYKKLFDNSSLHHEVVAISKNIFEFSDFLVNKLGITDFGASLNGKATYHDSCAGLRECGIKNEPRQLLANVKGLELIEMQDVETCCGFGGTFAVKFEPISIAMANKKWNMRLLPAPVILSLPIFRASCICRAILIRKGIV